MNKPNYRLTNTDDVLMDRLEVARLLGCNLTTLWRFTRSGKIPYYRAGRRMIFRKSEVLEAIRVK